MKTQRLYPYVLILPILCLLAAGPAGAVPSFARQTGMSCSACHTQFPELTPFGRQFKAGGYVLSSTKQVVEKVGEEPSQRTVLELPGYAPLSAMLIGSYTHTQSPQSATSKNDDVVLPDQFSFFYAGKIAPHVGGFIQLTYDGIADHFGFDNTDLRYANSVPLAGKTLVWGVSVNNNPTVTDLWNSTPAWSVASAISSGVAPTPAAAPLVTGLGGSVAGAAAYAFFDNFLYAEVDAYHSAPLGVSRPLDAATGATQVISGVMPYWRVAVEDDVGNNSITVGTYGLTGSFFPGGMTGGPPPVPNPLSGPKDVFTDLAVDAQYQYIGEHHIFSATSSYVHEQRTLDGSAALGTAANTTGELHSFYLSGGYIWERMVGLRATFASVRGSTDTGLYAATPVTGSANGSPKSTSITGEVTFTPWYNTRLGLQYTNYLDFNGGTKDYDGSGRAASANNTVFAYAWLAF